MVQQVEQLSTGYPQSEKWVEDERVFCHQCSNAVEVEQRQSMPAEQMERHRKVNAKPLQWMFDQAKILVRWIDQQPMLRAMLLKILWLQDWPLVV